MAEYCGNGKKHAKFEGSLSFGFNRDDLKKMESHLSEKGWVNVLISPTKNDPDKYYAKIDDFKPKGKHEGAVAQKDLSF